MLRCEILADGEAFMSVQTIVVYISLSECFLQRIAAVRYGLCLADLRNVMSVDDLLSCSLECFLSFHGGQQMSDFLSVCEFYLFLYQSFEGSLKISPFKNVP